MPGADVAEQLLEQERVAAGELDQAGELVGREGVAEQLASEPLGRPLAERGDVEDLRGLEREQLGVGVLGLGPGGDQQQQRELVEARPQRGQQRQARRVGPVQILEHEHQGGPPGLGPQPGLERELEQPSHLPRVGPGVEQQRARLGDRDVGELGEALEQLLGRLAAARPQLREHPLAQQRPALVGRDAAELEGLADPRAEDPEPGRRRADVAAAHERGDLALIADPGDELAADP